MTMYSLHEHNPFYYSLKENVDNFKGAIVDDPYLYIAVEEVEEGEPHIRLIRNRMSDELREAMRTGNWTPGIYKTFPPKLTMEDHES